MQENRKLDIREAQDMLQGLMSDWCVVLDKNSMDLIMLPDEASADEEDLELFEEIDEDTEERYLVLPDKYEINDYSIVEDFIYTLDDESMRGDFLSAIKGRGAFGRFCNRLDYYGIKDDWYAYKENAYAEIVKRWCQSNDVPYFDRKTGDTNVDDAARDNEIKDDQDKLLWKEVSVRHIIENEFIDLRESTYMMPDGSIYDNVYSYSRRDYVVIVATDENGEYICVRQFRQGIKEITTEFPAGGIERSDGKEYGQERKRYAEDALESAKRELKEETGYVSGEWRELLCVPSNATIADNNAYIFEAKNCTKRSDQDLDDIEFLEVCRKSSDEIKELIKNGEFQQAVHILAFMLSSSDASFV